MATAHETTRSLWRRAGGAAVALAGAALTVLCVLAWLVKAEVVSITDFNDPHWFVLIFLTFGSLALFALGVRNLTKH